MEKSTLSTAMTTAVPPKPTNLVFIGGQLRKIPRPRNAFMIFANEHRRHFQAMYPADTNNKISTRLGDAWHNMEKEVKANYFSRARAEDQEHKRKYPFYHYTPSLSKQFKQEMKRVKYVNRIRMLTPSPFVSTSDVIQLPANTNNLFSRLPTKSTCSITQNSPPMYQQLPYCEPPGTQPFIRPIQSASSLSNPIPNMLYLTNRIVCTGANSEIKPEVTVSRSTAVNREHTTNHNVTTEQPLLVAETLSKAVLDQITPFIQPRSPPFAISQQAPPTANKITNLDNSVTEYATLPISHMTQRGRPTTTAKGRPKSSRPAMRSRPTIYNDARFKQTPRASTTPATQQFLINDLEPFTYMVDNTCIRHLQTLANNHGTSVAKPIYIEDSNTYLDVANKPIAGPPLLAAALSTPPIDYGKQRVLDVFNANAIATDETNTLICERKQDNCLLHQSIITLPPINGLDEPEASAAAATATTINNNIPISASPYLHSQTVNIDHFHEENTNELHHARVVLDTRVSVPCENNSASTSQCILGAFKLLLDDDNAAHTSSSSPFALTQRQRNDPVLTKPWPCEEQREFLMDNLASTTNMREMATKSQERVPLETASAPNSESPCVCPNVMFGPCKNGVLTDMGWEVSCIVSPESTQKEQRVS